MNLKHYLQMANLTEEEFGKLVGVGQQAVNRWKTGLRCPRPRYMARIREATGGKVTSEDFYGSTNGDEAGSQNLTLPCNAA